MRQSFTEVINNNENDLFPAERVRIFIDGMLAALGYTQEGNQAKDEGLPDRISGKSVPVYYQVNDSDGAPRLQVLMSLSDNAEAGVLESPIEDGSGKDDTPVRNMHVCCLPISTSRHGGFFSWGCIR